MIHFCIDFLAILAPFWGSSWGLVGYFFGSRGGTWKNATLFFVGSVFFPDVMVVLTDFGRGLAGSDPLPIPCQTPAKPLPIPCQLFWRPWAPSGLDFGSFWSNFGSMLGPSWRYLGAFGCKNLHWMGWWGYAKRQEFSLPGALGTQGGGCVRYGIGTGLAGY